VAWGAYHGFFLIMDKLFWLDLQKRLPRLVNLTITLLLVMIGWTIFRADNIQQAWGYILTMFNPWDEGSTFIYVTANIWFFMVLGIILSLVPVQKVFTWFSHRIGKLQKITKEMELGLIVILFVITITKISAVTFNPFLYFRF